MTNSSPRKILVTDALCYANGSLHLGHILGCVQSDIWARFQKSSGHECHYICGSDAHGTPIMLNAEKQGITPEQLITGKTAEHQQDFHDFHIHFDQFGSTHNKGNQALINTAFEKMLANGDIETKTIKQAYDPKREMFLPDRFVKGICPKCKTADQYGDNCEACGATYSTSDLINPVSSISGEPAVEKESEHYFFKLGHYQDFLQQWITSGTLQSEITNKLQEWLDNDLHDWDISRDKPYFGFEIPNAPGKYFYVWLDAPVGYISIFKQFCEQNSAISFDQFWHNESTELVHFIGKDITYFHTLFWPAILKSANYRTPSQVHVHGFLTINGQKMSKSRGTFIQARDYLNHFDPEALRYYAAAKLSRGVEDIDLNLEDFMQRVNSDLVGKYINIASRSAGFISKKFDGQLSDTLLEPELFQKFAETATEIAQHYENKEYSKAMRIIMGLADLANQFIEKHEPWVKAKSESTLPEVQYICTMAINLFMQLTTYLQPVLPSIAKKTQAFLNLPKLNWQTNQTPLLHIRIEKFKPLMQRITPEQIEALKNSEK